MLKARPLLCWMALLAAFAVQAHTAKYAVIDLGAVQDGWTDATAVSSNGMAAGYANFNIAGEYRPALMARGQQPTVIYTDSAGQATGVNANGVVVGWYNNNVGQSFYWDGSAPTTLPSLGSGRTTAVAINDAGIVAGVSEVAGVPHAFAYQAGVMKDLGDWGGNAGAVPSAVNATGDMAGVRLFSDGSTVTQEGVRVIGGNVQPVVVPGSIRTAPLAINANGDVAGIVIDSTVDPDEVHPAFALIGTRAYRIAFPGAVKSTAKSINDSGQVVGNSNTGPGTRIRAFLWEGGKVVDLTTLREVQQAGWTWLQDATAINNDGVIVGTGSTPASPSRAFMLVPVLHH